MGASRKSRTQTFHHKESDVMTVSVTVYSNIG